MTLYQSLLMALVSLPFCVLESWGLKNPEKAIWRIVNLFKATTTYEILYTISVVWNYFGLKADPEGRPTVKECGSPVCKSTDLQVVKDKAQTQIINDAYCYNGASGGHYGFECPKMRPRGYPIPFCPLISRYDEHAHRPKRKHDAIENIQLPVMKRRVSSGSDYDHKVEERDEERYKSLVSRHKSKISAQFRRQDDRMPISPHPPLPVSLWPLLPPPPYLSSQAATPRRSLTDPGHCMSTPLSAPMYHRDTKRTREPLLSPPSQTPPWRSLSFEHTHIPEDLFRAPPSPPKWETRNAFDNSRRNSYNSPRRISLEDSIDFPRIPFNPPLPPLPPLPPPPPPPPPHAMPPKPRRHSDTYSGASRNEFKTPQRWRDRPRDKNTIYTSEEPRRRNEEWYSSNERERRRSTDYKNYNEEWMDNKRRKRW